MCVCRRVSLSQASAAIPSNYQLLEFVGDSALNLLVADWLFKRFPFVREGPLTFVKSALVSNAYFASKMLRR